MICNSHVEAQSLPEGFLRSEFGRNGRHILITGGAGFIGCNLAAHYARRGQRVMILDNHSRPGVAENVRWLKQQFGTNIVSRQEDVLNRGAVQSAVAGAEMIYHFAAQVAVTTSLRDPVHDFQVNALGTLNVLEACRRLNNPPPLLFTSTNKVYGNLSDLRLTCRNGAYMPQQPGLRGGVDEHFHLDFHSPYGCSKGVADQYVRDFARCYGLPTVVFRMSCIYGPHQCGTEDQGWVAHFARAVLNQQPITVFGDGCQVRDILYVDDLVRAMRIALERIDQTHGCAFNIGGGPSNAVSVTQVLQHLNAVHGELPAVSYGDWRQGDQLYYVSDNNTFQHLTGWHPEVTVEDGIQRLYHWLKQPCDQTTSSAANQHHAAAFHAEAKL